MVAMPSYSVSNSPGRVTGLPTEKLAMGGDLHEAQVPIFYFVQPKIRIQSRVGLVVMRTCNWDRAYANELPVLSKGLELSIKRTCAASGSMSFGECGKEVVLYGCARWGSGTVDSEWMCR